MGWYSVELDDFDEVLVSIDDEAMNNDLVRVVERTENQTRSVQITFAAIS